MGIGLFGIVFRIRHVVADQALRDGGAKQTGQILNGHLRSSISYYDAYESFYHGFLPGLLKGRKDWAIKSNNGISQKKLLCTGGQGKNELYFLTWIRLCVIFIKA